MPQAAGPRPRLLVFNQYYWPGIEATAQLLTELCEALADEWDVTVVTGTTAGAGPGRARRGGVEIVRLASTALHRRRLSARSLNYTTYAALAVAAGMRARRPDVVLAMTDPPFVGAAALLAARRFGAPLVVISQDVFPEAAVALGRLSNPVLVKAFGSLVSLYLRRAERVVAIGETMRRRLEEKGVEPRRLRVIPNWVDTTAIQPVPQGDGWAGRNGLAGRFVVMHSGNIGLAQDLDALIGAATFLRDEDGIAIVVIGAGARLTELRSLAERLEVEQVRFLPYQPRELLPASLSAAEVHVVGLARGLAGLIVPSRLYGILAAGRPVIVSAEEDSETAQLVLEAGCGVVVPPGRPKELADTIRAARRGEWDLAEMGRRARAYAVEHADRSVAVERYRALLNEVRGAEH